MDKVILSILSQKTGEDSPDETHIVSKMLLAQARLVSHFLTEVEDKRMSNKRVKMLFDWSNGYLKKLDEYKDRFYATHLNVRHSFRILYGETKKLKHKSRAFLERDIRAAISASSMAAMSKMKREGKL